MDKVTDAAVPEPTGSESQSDGSEMEESQEIDELEDLGTPAVPPRPGNEAFATAATGLRTMDLEGEPAEVDPETATDEEYYEQILDALKLYLSTSNREEAMAFDQGIAQKLLTGNLSELRRGGTPWKAEVKRMQMIGMHNRTIRVLKEFEEQLAQGTVMIDLAAVKGLHAIGMVDDYDPARMAQVLTQNPERIAANRKWATNVVQEIKNAGLMQTMNSPWLMIGLLIFDRLQSATSAARVATKKEIAPPPAPGPHVPAPQVPPAIAAPPQGVPAQPPALPAKSTALAAAFSPPPRASLALPGL